MLNIDLAALFARRAELEAEIAAARMAVEASLVNKKTLLDEVCANIITVSGPLAAAAYTRAEKVDGTVKFAAGDRIFKAAITKTVSYDSDKLREIANSIPWAQAQDVFKIKLDVSETVFKKLEDEGLKARIVEARTVKYGEPKITIED